MKGNVKSQSYYCYVVSGKSAGTEFKKYIYKFYYGLLKKRSDLLFLRFSAGLADENLQHREKILRGFIKNFFPLLIKELPVSFFS